MKLTDEDKEILDRLVSALVEEFEVSEFYILKAAMDKPDAMGYFVSQLTGGNTDNMTRN